MNDLVLLARLLEYPEDDGLLASLSHARELVVASSLGERSKSGLHAFLDGLEASDPLVVQESYVEMVDRNRRGSLHLFEHVHGESRERGGAMIDLQEFYATHGAKLATGELPDYLPVVLEFASQAPAVERGEFLAELLPVVATLVAEHSRKGSLWAPVLEVVLEACGGSLDDARRVRPVSGSEPSVDEIWQEPVVEFSGECAARGGEAT